LYLDPAGAAATEEDMENTAVAGMESAIKMLPGSIKFDFSSASYLSVRRDSRIKGCDLTVSGKQAQIDDSPINVMMRIQQA
jgi:hypothetical protein